MEEHSDRLSACVLYIMQDYRSSYAISDLDCLSSMHIHC